ncbi:MAG: hypothetical protein AAF611_00130 [Bacteroidota bacterium]
MSQEKVIQRLKKSISKLLIETEDLADENLAEKENELKKHKLKIDILIEKLYPLSVPGVRITKKTTKNIYYTIAPYIKPSNKLGLSNHPTDNLLAPVTFANYNAKNERLTISIILFIDTGYAVRQDEVSFNYNNTINGVGEVQFNVYAYFNRPGPILITGNYNIYSYTIFVNNSQNFFPNINTEGNKTVQVSLINVDPRTSRGTKTTIQPSTE